MNLQTSQRHLSEGASVSGMSFCLLVCPSGVHPEKESVGALVFF